MKEVENNGEDFIKKDKWKEIIFKTKGRFRCNNCDRNNKKKIEQNDKNKDKNAGWTTGNGTLEFLIKTESKKII